VKDTCIEFMIPDDEGILLLFKSQVATLHPEILDCLCLTRKELRVMFMIASSWQRSRPHVRCAALQWFPRQPVAGGDRPRPQPRANR
jgi:hypothetical protein